MIDIDQCYLNYIITNISSVTSVTSVPELNHGPTKGSFLIKKHLLLLYIFFKIFDYCETVKCKLLSSGICIFKIQR